MSPSGFYEWSGRPPSTREVTDEKLTAVIHAVHTDARGTYGARRVHAEMTLGRRIIVSRRRVERLMRVAGLQGVHRRRWRRDGGRAPAVFEDHVQRVFVADRPDRLWVTDITQHRSGEGWVYCAAVIDVYSRRCVGWSIADHLRTELIVDALDMARWRRHPTGTILHSDRGSQTGLKWSSQRLEREVMRRCRMEGNSGRRERIGDRSIRPGGLRSPGGRTVLSSGPRSRRACSPKSHARRQGCPVRSGFVGSVTLAG